MTKTHEQILELIDHFKENPVLWDNEHIQHHITTIISSVQNNIAKCMKTTAKDVEKKIIWLKHNATKEYKKAIKNATYMDDVTLVSTWPYMKALTFYVPTIEGTVQQWTQQRIYQLINYYKDNPSLWDIEHIDYGKEKVKMEILSSIGSKMKINSKLISSRLHYLYNRMIEEFKKLKEANKYCSTWRYYSTLSFLIPAIKLKQNERKWTREMTFRLINFYKVKPLLCDYEQHSYEDQHMRRRLLSKMSSVINISIKDIDERLDYLKNRMSDEVRKHVAVNTWVYYETLTFLIPIINRANEANRTHSK